MSLSKYLTTKQAADILKLSHVHIRHMISHGFIRAEKIGDRWLISSREVYRVLARREKKDDSNADGST